MRLDFTVNQNSEKCVQIIDSEGDVYAFSYIELVKRLYSERFLDTTTISKEYSDEDRTSINILVENINNSITKGMDGVMLDDIENAKNINETINSDLD